MTKENFAEELRNKLPEYMPDRCKNLRFCIKKINKNNGVELTGILIDDGSRCTPAIYIDEMYGECIWKEKNSEKRCMRKALSWSATE